MTLFTIFGKGIVKKIDILDDKKVIMIPEDWKEEYVRIYQLKEVKLSK
jgi:hypothetical protein